MEQFVDQMESPIGLLRLIWEPAALCALEFDNCRKPYKDSALTPQVAPSHIRGPIEAYFDGDLQAIDRVPVEAGGTAFQRQVWSALREIPFATTTTYGALAAKIGRPGASRAVGLANGANPVGIVVPCHRVIGSGGTLTGYSGGLDRKRWLLAHEQAQRPLMLR